MSNNQPDYDLCVCEVTRATYMAMLNEFRSINPNLRDRVDDPPKEDGNITYLALVGKAKGEKWHPLFGGNPFDDQRLGAGWVNTTTGYGGVLFKTRLDVPVPVAKVLQESRKALGMTHLECFDGKLRETYAKQGFVTVARSPFNREYAPETWNYDAEGEPDYLVMALPGSPTHKHCTKN